MSTERIRLGQKGEQLAVNYLVQKGYSILKQNYRCRIGEIDIVAEYNNFIVFIEVRTRSTNKFGTPAESVTPLKQKRIQRVAQHFLHKYPEMAQRPVRFDVIAINAGKEEMSDFEHYLGAY